MWQYTIFNLNCLLCFCFCFMAEIRLNGSLLSALPEDASVSDMGVLSLRRFNIASLIPGNPHDAFSLEQIRHEQPD